MARIRVCLAVLVTPMALPAPAASEITLLHEFAGGSYDGSYPYGSLTLDGSTLYGMTRRGSFAGDQGTIFSISRDGSDFTLLHEFRGGRFGGSLPRGSLTLGGSTLYGMTAGGGTPRKGVVFSIGTDGRDFTVLHEFAGGPSDGQEPRDSLTLSGSTLYGMTPGGGNKGMGTIFSVGTDGSGFTLLHEFAGGPSDGAQPLGSLTLSGATLYGMTLVGGHDHGGTIFSIGTDGSNFRLLHDFTYGHPSMAGRPYGSPTLGTTTLYGMTSSGGNKGMGTIFSIGTDGSDFALLHEFRGRYPDGDEPLGSLALSGSTLYGMTSEGGGSDRGTIFAIGTDGSGFTLLHHFRGKAGDGERPHGSLTPGGSTLYGMTPYGGDWNRGTVFSIRVPEPGGFALTLTALCGLALLRYVRRRLRPASG